VPAEDPGWYLPAEFLTYRDSVSGGLPVGAPGKVGRLDVALAPRGGTTRMCRHYQRAPLHLYRPIYLDPARPDMAFLYLQQFGDGLVQGDRYRIDIDCAPGSAAHLTTQAATKVYGANENFASQLVNLRVGADAVLEYLPDPILPFRGSRLYGRTRVVADPESTVILAETLLPGRVAYGEDHDYDLYWAETEVTRPDGTLLFADVLRLRGKDARSIGRLGDNGILATMYILAPQSRPLVELLRGHLACCTGVLAGVSELPNCCGVAVKLLGDTSAAVQSALHTSWDTVRRALLGIPAPNLRKG
jgi:urease accessory protein